MNSSFADEILFLFVEGEDKLMIDDEHIVYGGVLLESNQAPFWILLHKICIMGFWMQEIFIEKQ